MGSEFKSTQPGPDEQMDSLEPSESAPAPPGLGDPAGAARIHRRRIWKIRIGLFTLILIAVAVSSYFGSVYRELDSDGDPWTFVLLKDGGVTFAYLGNNAPPRLLDRPTIRDAFPVWRRAFITMRDANKMAAEFEIEELREGRQEPSRTLFGTKGRESSQIAMDPDQLNREILRIERNLAREYEGMRKRVGPLIDRTARQNSVLGFYFHLETTLETDVYIRVPIWSGIAPLIAIGMWFMSTKRIARSRRRKGLCGDCGYPMEGNVSGICPECGEPLKVAG